MIPIMALAIPVAAIVFGGLVKLKRLQIEEAHAKAGGLGPGGEEEIRQLRDELDQLRGEVTEMQERLDFTERLLARSSDKDKLPPAS
jgi:NAD(P)H-dependent flavin oxidoreductase YrpB (nitropropane dioxygenase family)